jgi:prevent-host-death family protein
MEMSNIAQGIAAWSIIGIITTSGDVMEESVTAAEANRHFSRILRSVRNGQSFVVTSHGRPVARLIPANQFANARSTARDALLSRLRQQPIVQVGRWTRDELYEDED